MLHVPVPSSLHLHGFTRGRLPAVHSGGVVSGRRQTLEGVVNHAHFEQLPPQVATFWRVCWHGLQCLQEHEVGEETEVMGEGIG